MKFYLVRFSLTLSFVATLAATAARADNRPGPLDDAPLASQISQVAARAKEVFRSRCWECHGGAAAQDGIRILDRDLLVLERKVVIAGDASRSPLFRLIEKPEGGMPPEGRPGLSAPEMEVVRAWIAAGAPPFPSDVARPDEADQEGIGGPRSGADYVLSKILEHQSSAGEESRLYIRYFSINHLLSSGSTRDALDVARDALSKTINHLSSEPKIVRPVSVDRPLDTVYAVDVRQLGWQKRLLDKTESGKEAGQSSVDLFDLVLLEYPYGIVYPDSPTFQRVVEQYCLPAGLVRPIPYVRADWFVSATLQPPLYYDLLQLPEEVAQLEAKLGVTSADNVRDGVARRAGLAVSGVSRNNRVVERHPSSTGAYWKSFDFRSSKGDDNCFREPITLHPAGGEMIFNLPNGLQGYFLAGANGRRLDSAPTEMVVDRHAEDKTVRNALSCVRCHDRGMKPFVDTMRPGLERAPASPGFDRRLALQLYPPREEMQSWLEEDTQRFMAALGRAVDRPAELEPITLVTQRFLDGPLSLFAAAGELGLADAASLTHLFRTPHLIGLGMVPLASGGVVRRDMWEDYFDQLVRALGVGVPIVPLDGLARADYASENVNVELTTNKPSGLFAAGDELVVIVKNNGSTPLFVELIGTGTRGEKVVLVPAGAKIEPGKELRFPESGGITIQAGAGAERITLFASESQFAAGELLKGHGVLDRFVHACYQVSTSASGVRLEFDPAKVVKKTLVVETK